MPLKTFRARTLALAAVGALTLTGTALAAHPKATKKYSGTTTEAKVKGKRPTVVFRVSKDGKKLIHFSYQSVGCYAGASLVKQTIGTLAVSSSGAFSVRNVKTNHSAGARTLVTTSSVSGKFKSSGTATGTITYSQSVVIKGGPQIKPCAGKKMSFTAKVVSSSSPISGGY